MAVEGAPGRHAKAPSYETQVTITSQQWPDGSAGYGQAPEYRSSRGDTRRYHRSNYGRRKKRSIGKIVAGVLAGLLALFLAAFVVSGVIMFTSLDGIRTQANQLQKGLVNGDPKQAESAAVEIAKTAETLDGQTSLPHWTIASFIPVIGEDFATVRTMTHTANLLCSEVAVPATKSMVASNTGPAIVDGNRINAPAIKVLLETLAGAQDTVAACSADVHALNNNVIGQLDSARRLVRGYLGGLDRLAQASPALSANITDLLGANGTPKRYLFVGLSSAEVRSIGGLPGSYGILSIDNGKLHAGDFLALKDTPRFVPTSEEMIDTETVAPGLTDEERILFGRRVVNVPAETATNPQFSRFAESFSYLYTYREHGETDGVIAVSMELIASVLGVTGSVTTSDGTVVDGSNAARLLLHDAYSTKTPEEQDAFFAEVATSCFNQLLDNISSNKLLDLMQVFWHTHDTRHLQTWIPNDQVESALATLGYAGQIPSNEQEPTLGVYVNDDTWSKISWYLSMDTVIGASAENGDGSRSYQVTTTLKNHLTQAEAESQPDYVVGSNWRKRSRADMLDWLFLYAPTGGTITNVKANAYFTPLGRTRSGFNGIEQVAGMNQATHLGHEVWFGQLQLDAGEVATITYTVTTSPAATTNNLAIDQTPTAQETAGW